MAIIEAINLSQKRDGRQILRDISLAVAPGETLAVIGPTGAGKTTLLRLLDLLDPPAGGRILFKGTDVTSSARLRLEARRRMALVLQRPLPFDGSVSDNVVRGLAWRGLSRGEVQQRTARALETVGLAGYQRRHARTLSGGELQRLALARAISLEPEVLLLDEPTANLDPVSAAEAEHIIRSIGQQGQAAIIMATHDMAQGQRLADRAAVLLNGELVQAGPWAEIFNAPRHRDLASLVGIENIIDGVITASQEGVATISRHGHQLQALSSLPAGEPVSVCIRAEEVTLAREVRATSARNTFAGPVARLTTTGPVVRVEIDCGFRLVALVTRRSAEEMGLAPGQKVYASFKATAAHVLRREPASKEHNK